MTDEERVEAVKRAIAVEIYRTIEPDARAHELTEDEVAGLARAAIAVIRPAVLEEAAKVADSACIPMCEGSADLIAAAIRALKEKEPTRTAS